MAGLPWCRRQAVRCLPARAFLSAWRGVLILTLMWWPYYRAKLYDKHLTHRFSRAGPPFFHPLFARQPQRKYATRYTKVVGTRLRVFVCDEKYCHPVPP
ncbi:unnamed protein product, partial [Amoebophrya sp. A120]|eukprot:GSA120T00024750001.1